MGLGLMTDNAGGRTNVQCVAARGDKLHALIPAQPATILAPYICTERPGKQPLTAAWIVVARKENPFVRPPPAQFPIAPAKRTMSLLFLKGNVVPFAKRTNV